jgi:hypothetical protein
VVVHNYCTMFSKDSLYKGLLLYDSLVRYDESFQLFIICMEEEVKHLLDIMQLRNATTINIKDIEEVDSGFSAIKGTRNEKEYAWSAKAPIILYLFGHFDYLNHMIYLDADIEFYSSPEPIYKELENYSTMLTRERFYIQDNEDWYRQYGLYNGGFMAFKRDENAMECLLYLREKCINWCYNRAENGLYGDQKYTADWTERFKRVGVVRNMGINATAWYAHASVIEQKDNRLYINDTPIVFYHYNGLNYYNKNEFDLCVFISLPKHLVDLIYVPYLRRLQETIKKVGKLDMYFYSKTLVSSENQYKKNYFRLESRF